MSVLVYIQNFNGRLRKQNFELASYGREIANQQDTLLVGLVIGGMETGELQKMSRYGVDKIIHVNNEQLNKRINRAYTHVIQEVVMLESITTILFSDNNTGKALGPRLSVRLKAGFVPGVVDLPSGYSPITIKRSVYSGKAFSDVKVVSEKQILSLAINTYKLVEKEVNTDIVEFTPSLDEKDMLVHITKSVPSDKAISLADADIVVSGGRGMKSPDNWKKLEDLADTLQAALACSRPVADDGWRPSDEHVGQTGKIIAPDLYIAVGISGAIQHVAGVSGSKKILAINTDAEAPIFKVANYGIVGDANNVIPAFTEAIKSFKGGN